MVISGGLPAFFGDLQHPLASKIACALCRSRRELSNAYFLAKFGLDSAENEPCQVPIESYDPAWGVAEVVSKH